MEVATFTCSICGESSRKICVYCTKDTCANHLCERCHRCSDCCLCETPLLLQELPNGTLETSQNGHLTEIPHLVSDDAPTEVMPDEKTEQDEAAEQLDDPPPSAA